MHRSSSNTRVADEYYKNLSSSSNNNNNSSSSLSSPSSINDSNGSLPTYSPGSHAAKKEKLRLRSAENAVHLIPLVLVLCAVILWFFSNPVEVVNKKPDSVVARVEGLKAAGAVGIDGTQNSLLAHMELEDVVLLHQHHHQTTEQKPSNI